MAIQPAEGAPTKAEIGRAILTLSDRSGKVTTPEMAVAGMVLCRHVLDWETQARAAMQDFVDKCDRGEARSVRTYAKFKELLK